MTILAPLLACCLLADAAPTATPTPTPAPYRIALSIDGYSTFIDQATNGAGVTPPEGAGFAAGSPLSPLTPYDTFSSAASIPGVAAVTQLGVTASYAERGVRGAATLALGAVDGSVQNAAYWGESLLPALNPHLGSTALPYAISFPTHAGQDDGSALRASLVSGSIGAVGGAWLVRGGWFDLQQSDRFVFVQPPLTNSTPAVIVQTAETLGNGSPTLATWPSPPPGLPLAGIDAVYHHGDATVELTNAALPALPGTPARLSMASVVFDRGEGTRFSAQLLHVASGGAILSSTTLFGQAAMLNPGPQGPLPTSQLGGQRETIAGLRGAFHATKAIDAVIEIGRSWYDAYQVLLPGTSRPGGFYHIGLSRAIGRVSAGVDAYRFEGRYASAFLPYGAPENVWSVVWSWPAIWLKSTYQLVDNTIAGSNRQGYRLHYNLDRGPVELHAAFSTFRQIQPADLDVVHQVGFVEGFFLPQQPGAATLGVQHQYAVWAAWHPPIADLALDFVEDTLHRDALAAHPEDAVSLAAPQAVLSASKSFSPFALGAVGVGSYHMRGAFAHAFANVDFTQTVAFAGAQLAESKTTSILIEARHSVFRGLPSIPGGPPPNFNGTLLVVEQRIHM